MKCVPPEHQAFNPLMTLYLTDNTTVETVRSGKASRHVIAFKLYPAGFLITHIQIFLYDPGATTNSDNGVTDVWKLLPVFERMAQEGVLLLVHGEVTDETVDVFDREKAFIHTTLV